MQPEESLRIINRFYEALDKVIEMEKISGITAYCKYHNIDRRNFILQKDEPNRAQFKVSWMAPLVRYYGINPRWLLTGQGRMMKELNL